MITVCACRHLSQKPVRVNLTFTYRALQSTVPCLSFQSFHKQQVNTHLCGWSANGCLRCFSSSHQSFMFWRDQNIKVPNHQKVVTSPQTHDRKTLLDRYIFVKTLDNYYGDVPNGIILDTAYADSRPGEDFDPIVPVVVGLHDTPGSHHDLVPLLSVFAKMGCRTIAPTFPGHGNTQGLMSGFDDVFCQSTMEKAIFVNDFLGDLDIKRVDLLIGVGAACYPTLQLCVSEATTKLFRSMALISPWPFQRPRYEPNQELTKSIQFLWDRPFFRAPVRLLLPAYKVGDITRTRDKITAAYLLNNLNLSEVIGLALAAGSIELPRVVVFGEMDHAVEKELYHDVLDRLGIPKTNISTFKGKLDSPCLPGALVFPDGGYDLHLKHAGIVGAFLLDIVRLFHPHIRM